MSSKPDNFFTGLSNQGATCYMNSLLQSLFMTPELRKSIYEWRYERSKHGPKETCIPFQLQVLFGKLQLSQKPFIETNYLTRSFGWDSKESFQQHDVQEFCRVLFEAIEESVKFTDSEDLISSLYEGFLTDYVKCLACGHESKRTDSFLDLSLTVRNDFEGIKNDSIEKALLGFTRPELLTGSNRYFCASCNIKVDAKKGLKIEKFPYVLVAQIKRFDLNYQTFQRIKLNDRVSFPLILNCNRFLGDFQEIEVKVLEGVEEEKVVPVPVLVFESPSNGNFRAQTTTGYEGMYEDKDKKCILPDQLIHSRIVSEQTTRRKQQQDQLITQYKKEGENVYELFSIMIHSGSALGGHYFAYIKDLESCKWFNFNDSLVKEIEEKELSKAFGGDSYANSSNAYLLMYRKISSENIISLRDLEVPLHVIQEIQTQFEEESKEKDIQTITFKVIHNKKEQSFKVRKDQSMNDFKRQVMQSFEITESSENVRLRSFNSLYEVLQETFDEEKKISNLPVWDFKVLGIEIKSPEAEWQAFNPNLITLKVFVWDDSINFSSQPEPVLFQFDKTSSGNMLKKQLSEKFCIPENSLIVIKKTFSSSTPASEEILKEKGDFSLQSLKIYENSSLYIESFTQVRPKWQSFIEIEGRRVKIRFNNPEEDLPQRPDCKYFILIDKESTLQCLKSLISQKILIPEDKFIMKRSNSLGAEVKDLTLKLVQANFTNNSLIIIEKGTPARLSEFKIAFSLALNLKKTENASKCYDFSDLVEMTVDCSLQVVDVKALLVKEVKKMFPAFDVDVFKMRFRERNFERLTKCLRNSESFKDFQLFDRKMICLQVLDHEEEEVLPLQMIVVAKRWNPETWQVSPAQEFTILRNSSMSSLCETFSNFFKIEVIPKKLSKLQVCKLNHQSSFQTQDLSSLLFIKPFGTMTPISSSPWLVSLDGVLFFVKSSDEKIHSFPSISQNIQISSEKPQNRLKDVKETGIRIKVTKGENPE